MLRPRILQLLFQRNVSAAKRHAAQNGGLLHHPDEQRRMDHHHSQMGLAITNLPKQVRLPPQVNRRAQRPELMVKLATDTTSLQQPTITEIAAILHLEKLASSVISAISRRGHHPQALRLSLEFPRLQQDSLFDHRENTHRTLIMHHSQLSLPVFLGHR